MFNVTDPDGKSLTSRKGLSQNFRREGRLRARARGSPVLEQVVVFAQHVPPPPVEEAVQNIGGDDVCQRERLRLEAGFEGKGLSGQHGAHGDRSSRL